MLKKSLTLFAALTLSSALAAPLRVMVLMRENNQWYENNHNLASASTGMTQVFLKSGFVVIDKAQLGEVKNRNMILNVLNGDVKAAIALESSFDADAIVIGNAVDNRSIGANLGPFAVQGYSGTADVRAIVASPGQVLGRMRRPNWSPSSRP